MRADRNEERSMSGQRLLRVRVTLKGRPVRAYAFTQEAVLIGRNPECDVFLDNPGISRDHAKLTRTTRETYFLEDLGSANGTMINDVRVERAELRENDVVQIGKFSLWMTYDMDRRQEDDTARRASLSALEGTTVLKASELQDMIDTTRQAEARFRASTAAGTEVRAPASAGPLTSGLPGAPALAGVPARTGPALVTLFEGLPPRIRIGLLATGVALFVLGTAVGAAASLVLVRGSHLLGR
jgi:predicted component of type VI protein secretion system